MIKKTGSTILYPALHSAVVGVIERVHSGQPLRKLPLHTTAADCADGNKDVRIEATLLIPRQQAKPNHAVKSRRETALIRLCNTYKRCGSSPIDRMPRCGQIVCLGSDLNQNSNLIECLSTEQAELSQRWH